MKKLLLLAPLVLLLLVSCTNVHDPYYKSPSGGGYYKQVIGARCAHCSREMLVSWAQYNQHENIKCPYCGGMSNLKQACATHV